MNKYLLSAWREFRVRVATKVFLLTMVASASLVMAAIMIPQIINNKPKNIGFGISSVSDSAAYLKQQVLLGVGGNVPVKVTAYASDKELETVLKSGEISLGFSKDDVFVTDKTIEGASFDVQLLYQALSASLNFREASKLAGLNDEQVAILVSRDLPKIRSLKPTPNKADSARQAGAFVGILFSFLLIQTYGSWILMSVIEEKSSRVIEVILAVIQPRQLLGGKVLGLAGAAFLNALVVGGAAITALKGISSPLLAGVGVGSIGLTMAWAFSGFLLYSWLFAAAGSMCTRVDEAQNAVLPLTIPLLLGYLVSISSSGVGGETPLLKFFSYFPLTSPFAAQARYGHGTMNVSLQLLSLAILIASTIAVSRFAGMIYERSILQTNKRLSWQRVMKKE